MKTTLYLRVAHDPKARNARGRQPRFAVSQSPTAEPIMSSDRSRALPTVAFALDVNLPDAMFARASQVVAELNVREEDATIAAEVVQR